MSEKVKPGYKQTEVGVIPEEWEVARSAILPFIRAVSRRAILPRGLFVRITLGVTKSRDINVDSKFLALSIRAAKPKAIMDDDE